MPSHASDAPSGQVSRRSMLRGGAAAALATSVPLAANARQATPAAAQVPDIDAIDRFAGGALEQYGVPGAVVVVVQRGEPVLVKGYGVRSIESDAPVDADTVFQLASNTKPMTAFTLGTLVDEGVVDWTTPASEVVLELRLMDPYATLHAHARDLLAHRGGFPAFYGDLLAELGYDNEETIRRIRYVVPASTFRDVAAYNNLGYTIVGEMIARLTGGSWEDAMNARLFAPLGMTRSGASLADLPADDNVSANHAIVNDKLVTVEVRDIQAIGAGGSAISTGNDMAHWMSALLSGGMANGEQVLQPETVRTMFEPVIPAEISFAETTPISAETGFSFSPGWGVFHWHGYEVLEKGGALDGIRTVVNLVPELELGIAVLANLNLTFLPEAVRAFALEQFLGQSDTDMQAEITALAASLEGAFSAPEPPADALPAEVPLENFAGAYEQDLFGRFDITADGDSLRVEAGPASLEPALEHFSLNTFLLDWGGATQVPEQLTFVLGPDGQAVAFEHESLGRFERVDA